MWNEMNWFGGEQRQKKKICARALTSMHIFQLDFYLTNQPRACCCCFFSSCSIRVVTLAYTTGLNFASKHSSAWCLCLICRVSEAKKRTPSALCMHTASVKIVGALLYVRFHRTIVRVHVCVEEILVTGCWRYLSIGVFELVWINSVCATSSAAHTTVRNSRRQKRISMVPVWMMINHICVIYAAIFYSKFRREINRIINTRQMVVCAQLKMRFRTLCMLAMKFEKFIEIFGGMTLSQA